MADPIPFLMTDASRLFRRLFDARVRHCGITGPQWRLLAVILRNPGITQSTAADLTDVEPITLSRMVDRLVDAGLVERQPVPGDRRARALTLTERATPLIETMRTEATQLVEEAFDGFSDDERAMFVDHIERFRANLSRRDQPA